MQRDVLGASGCRRRSSFRAKRVTLDSEPNSCCREQLQSSCLADNVSRESFVYIT